MLPDNRLSYRTLQWLVAVFALLHNLEEAVMMPAFVPLMRERLSAWAPSALLAATEHLSWFYIALMAATLVPFFVVVAAVTRRTSRVANWAVVFVQAIFFANVFVPHVPAALVMAGYAPGVVTAVAIQLPFSMIFLRRSVREGVVSGASLVLTLALGVLALLVLLGALYLVAGKVA